MWNLYTIFCIKQMEIVESNQDDSNSGHNYLSAGETPLPALYFMMSILFFVAGCFWVLILRKSRYIAINHIQNLYV